VIYDERPDKPFDRDTEVRLTGAELAARGATDLATALALLPEINVRDAGRGGFNIDVRGARKGDVAVLIEGVETEEQLAWLTAEGCGEVQGYLFSRPVPAKDLHALIPSLNQQLAA